MSNNCINEMEIGEKAEETLPVANSEDTKDNDSAENFQKFIYELFEKNGILNDLRSYLRGHIVNVLKSAQTGDPPACQKHFTQRLELSYQALNIIIAEYLLCLEFSYSLSVFVSEIPLANMVFEFSKTLMQSGITTDANTSHRFKDNDVWSVLNYLGVKCDSEHASNIIEMYKSNQNWPLLLCILKCTPMYRKESIYLEQGKMSEDSLSSSTKSSGSQDDKHVRNSPKITSFHEKCKHYALCKICQSRMLKLRDKYNKKKKHLVKNLKATNLNPMNVDSLMKNINIMEKSLIDEMFHQLKTVYEGEVEMMKEEEQRKIKRSLASHALQVQKRQDEMEEAFKEREAELERNVQQKKQFLWGLAKSLRDQHQQMSRAMRTVKFETERLSAKEESLKGQLVEAENVLKKRGEEMRKQISAELSILEGHLESMKKERDNINKERSELENLKTLCDSNSKTINVHDMEADDLRAHYDLLRNEFAILRKYIETTKMEPKCVIERSTLTELHDVTSKINIILNNEQEIERNYLKSDSDERTAVKTPNQVVNDLKKQKNVNFSQSNLDEIYRERSRDRSRSSGSSEAGDALADNDHDRVREQQLNRDHEIIQRLRDENERLRIFARQQQEHIEELSSHQERLQAELRTVRCKAMLSLPPTPTLAHAITPLRPRTAPAVLPTHAHTTLYSQCVGGAAGVTRVAGVAAGSTGWRAGAGAGEELGVLSAAAPRVVVPGDTLPFVGVVGLGAHHRDRPHDARRHLMNQWRTLRRRTSPLSSVGKLRSAAPPHGETPVIIEPNTSTRPMTYEQISNEEPTQDQRENKYQINKICDNDNTQLRPKSALPLNINKNREKSPKSVLREAKERLRSKDNVIEHLPSSTREKSPSSVLREAKLRLRKLEIEAEAVEKSYLDFRRRQSELRNEREIKTKDNTLITNDIMRDLDKKRSRSLHKFNENCSDDVGTHSKFEETQNCIQKDFDKYLREYQTKFNIGELHFKNKNAVAELIKPIPKAYSEIDKQIQDAKKKENNNYLETPLTEFRKLYRSQNFKSTSKTFDDVPTESRPKSPCKKLESPTCSETSNKDIYKSTKKLLRLAKNDKKAELEILKENINKMYNIRNAIPKETIAEDEIKTDSSKLNTSDVVEETNVNFLKIEVEEIRETNNLKTGDSQPQGDLLLVVESSVDTKAVTLSESESQNGEKISTHMTIIVSPKRSNIRSPIASQLDRITSPDKSKRSESPEQAARLTRNDVLDAIFHADPVTEYPSVEMKLQLSTELEDSISEVEEGREYPDADCNSGSGGGNNSPISLPKTSEDENFWDS